MWFPENTEIRRLANLYLMLSIVDMTKQEIGKARIRESKQAPYAAYDVIYCEQGKQKGKHVFSIINWQ